MQLIRSLVAAFALVAGTSYVAAGPIIGQGTWETTLKARDINGNAVALDSASAAFFYDTTLNVTWLANMNAGAGSSFDNGSSSTDGRMSWGNAMNWADSLTAGGFNDWRLPEIGPVSGGAYQYSVSYNGTTDVGTAKTGTGWGNASEWGHLYYVTLGNLGFCTPNDALPGACSVQAGWGLSNTAHFQNAQSNFYWSGTEFSQDPALLAWAFNAAAGGQNGGYDKRDGMYAVAVRSGDVLREAGTVPEPHTLALVVIALIGIRIARCRSHSVAGQ